MWDCTICKAENEDGFSFCWSCGTSSDGTDAVGIDSGTPVAENIRKMFVADFESDEDAEVKSVADNVVKDKHGGSRTQRAMARYKHAYTMARFIDGFGLTVRGIGITLGLLGILAGLLLAAETDTSLLPTALGILLGATIGFAFYVVGIIVSAHGQHLKASLDISVCSSPFMDDDQKAAVMSLD